MRVFRSLVKKVKNAIKSKRKVPFNQGIMISLASLVSWYGLSAGFYFLLGRLSEGSDNLLLLSLLILMVIWAFIPVGLPVGVSLLFNARRQFTFNHWFALGMLAAYFVNIVASYLFPPFVSAYLLDLGLFTFNIPRDLTIPNGGLAAYVGLPFFIAI